MLYLSGSSRYNIVLYNLQGRLVLSKGNASGLTNLSLNGLSDGKIGSIDHLVPA